MIAQFSSRPGRTWVTADSGNDDGGAPSHSPSRPLLPPVFIEARIVRTSASKFLVVIDESPSFNSLRVPSGREGGPPGCLFQNYRVEFKSDKRASHWLCSSARVRELHTGKCRPEHDVMMVPLQKFKLLSVIWLTLCGMQWDQHNAFTSQ